MVLVLFVVSQAFPIGVLLELPHEAPLEDWSHALPVYPELFGVIFTLAEFVDEEFQGLSFIRVGVDVFQVLEPVPMFELVGVFHEFD